MSHVTRTPLSRSKGEVKGQLVVDVLNSQHAGVSFKKNERLTCLIMTSHFTGTAPPPGK